MVNIPSLPLTNMPDIVNPGNTSTEQAYSQWISDRGQTFRDPNRTMLHDLTGWIRGELKSIRQEMAADRELYRQEFNRNTEALALRRNGFTKMCRLVFMLPNDIYKVKYKAWRTRAIQREVLYISYPDAIRYMASASEILNGLVTNNITVSQFANQIVNLNNPYKRDIMSLNIYNGPWHFGVRMIREDAVPKDTNVVLGPLTAVLISQEDTNTVWNSEIRHSDLEIVRLTEEEIAEANAQITSSTDTNNIILDSTTGEQVEVINPDVIDSRLSVRNADEYDRVEVLLFGVKIVNAPTNRDELRAFLSGTEDCYVMVNEVTGEGYIVGSGPRPSIYNKDILSNNNPGMSKCQNALLGLEANIDPIAAVASALGYETDTPAISGSMKWSDTYSKIGDLYDLYTRKITAADESGASVSVKGEGSGVEIDSGGGSSMIFQEGQARINASVISFNAQATQGMGMVGSGDYRNVAERYAPQSNVLLPYPAWLADLLYVYELVRHTVNFGLFIKACYEYFANRFSSAPLDGEDVFTEVKNGVEVHITADTLIETEVDGKTVGCTPGTKEMSALRRDFEELYPASQIRCSRHQKGWEGWLQDREYLFERYKQNVRRGSAIESAVDDFQANTAWSSISVDFSEEDMIRSGCVLTNADTIAIKDYLKNNKATATIDGKEIIAAITSVNKISPLCADVVEELAIEVEGCVLTDNIKTKILDHIYVKKSRNPIDIRGLGLNTTCSPIVQRYTRDTLEKYGLYDLDFIDGIKEAMRIWFRDVKEIF